MGVHSSHSEASDQSSASRRPRAAPESPSYRTQSGYPQTHQSRRRLWLHRSFRGRRGDLRPGGDAAPAPPAARRVCRQQLRSPGAGPTRSRRAKRLRPPPRLFHCAAVGLKLHFTCPGRKALSPPCHLGKTAVSPAETWRLTLTRFLGQRFWASVSQDGKNLLLSQGNDRAYVSSPLLGPASLRRGWTHPPCVCSRSFWSPHYGPGHEGEQDSLAPVFTGQGPSRGARGGLLGHPVTAG